MKKAIFSFIISAAFVFGMTSCNNNGNTTEEPNDTTCTEQTECKAKCELPECTCTMEDCVCKKECAMCDDTTCARCKAVAECKAKKEACGEEPQCCKEQQECCKEQKECCKKEATDCKKECKGDK